MASDDSLVGVFRALFAWRKRLLGLTAAVCALTAGVSFLMPEYFESSTSFYAAGPALNTPDGVFASADREVEYFGAGADRDRLMTVATGTPFHDRMIDSFGLMERYGIDPADPKAREKARLRFQKHYEVTETKYDGIQLSIEDRDPRVAADMANGGRDLINALTVEYLGGGQKKMLQTIEASIAQKQQELDMLVDSLDAVQRSTGVYHWEEQSKLVGYRLSEKLIELAGDKARLDAYKRMGYNNRDTIANVTARIAAFENQVAELTGRKNTEDFDIRRFNAGAGQVAMLQQQYHLAKNQLSYEIQKANHLRSLLEGRAIVIIPFEIATPPVVKSRPKRLFLVLGAGFLTLLFGSLFVLLRDRYRQIEWHDAPAA